MVEKMFGAAVEIKGKRYVQAATVRQRACDVRDHFETTSHGGWRDARKRGWRVVRLAVTIDEGKS